MRKDNVYKGRIVFRGDDVRNEEGFLAVFTEQGASAAHITQTFFVRRYCAPTRMQW